MSVTAAIESGPAVTLGGTLTVNTSGSGVATYSNLKITGHGTFTLKFSAGSLPPALSNPIQIP